MDIWLAVIDGIVGILILAVLITHNVRIIPYGLALGLWIGAVGLLAQAYTSHIISDTGIAPFNDLPVWIFKDVGYWVILVALLKKYRSQNSEGSKRPE